MKKVTLVSGEPGAGHAIELSLGLREYVDLTTVWRVKSAYKFDYIEPQGLYGLQHIPYEGDEIIIVSLAMFNVMRKYFRNVPGGLPGFLSGYDEVKIVITDDRIMFDPDAYNNMLEGYQVWATICKIHFRGDNPTKPYYRPFDLTGIDRTKHEKITVGHSPFVNVKRKEKGTQAIMDTVAKIPEADFDLISNLTWDEAIKRKAKCHIFVDQIDHYKKDQFKYNDSDYTWLAWGKSGDEAMHLGCLTITGGSDRTTDYSVPPIIWCDGNLKELLRYYVSQEKEREERAEEQRQWQLKHATRDAAARNLLNL